MRLAFILVFLSATSGAFAQVLFTYGPDKVTRQEFLRAYNKNKNANVDQPTSLRDYLDLYIKFKLKVKAAQELRLDTLPSLIAEYTNFRSQIEESYLDDDKTVDQLVQEAFRRSQEDIRVNHLFIPLPASADSSKALAAVESVKQRLASKQSFSEIANQLQNLGINASAGDIGYITVFSLPYVYENVIYQLKDGEVSAPVRAKNGFHIFQRIGKRKAAGKMKAAQILVAIPAEATEEQRRSAQRRADSIYKVLKAGASFEELAKTHSDDKMTYMTGGVMPEFGTGKYDIGFESRVFALKNNGDITEPFLTPFGYHIVKQIERKPVSSDITDPNVVFALKQQVQQDSRIAVAREKFIADVLKKIQFKKNAAVKGEELLRITDSFMNNPNYRFPTGKINGKTILHSFTNGKATVDEWLRFARENRFDNSGKPVPYPDLMNKFVASTATAYYRKRLEDFSPEFKFQLQEFKEGNMLFEIMERNVWQKASLDTPGLKKHYEQNRGKYLWEPSAQAILVTAANAKLADEVAEAIRKSKDHHRVLQQFTNDVQFDSGRFELNQIPVRDRTNFQEGLVTAPVVNESDGTSSFAVIIKLLPGKQQRSFEEARGLVINDYQTILEQRWIESLKKKYPVKINEAVFAQMKSAETATSSITR
jgi:peptidyl-prolyl cis-trans isomerase SurA